MWTDCVFLGTTMEGLEMQLDSTCLSLLFCSARFACSWYNPQGTLLAQHPHLAPVALSLVPLPCCRS